MLHVPSMEGLGVCGIGRQNMLTETPFMDCLIVNVGVRLRQECNEAVLEPKLYSRRAGVLASAGTPEVQLYTLCVQLADCGYDAWHWNSLHSY